MPVYRHFYVECRSADGWTVPVNFEPQWSVFDSQRCFGQFVWAHPRSGWLGLFESIHPLFSLRPGPPPDRRGSALLKDLDCYYDYQRNEDHLSWLPYEELFVDHWDTDSVLVCREVESRYALLFGNGQQSFPQEQLLGSGVDEQQLDRMRNGWPVEEAIDMTFGPHRFRLSELPPERKIAVTWRETIAGFIGPQAYPFQHLRRYGRDEELRILYKLG